MKRKPQGARAPKKPLGRAWRKESRFAAPDRTQHIYFPPGSARRVHSHVRKLLRIDRPTQALDYLDQASIQTTLDVREDAIIRAHIAGAYFLLSMDNEALAVASESTQRGGQDAALGHWYAGLAAWRLDQFEIARHHFTTLAHCTTASDWTRAAGAVWAARTSQRLGYFAEVTPLLESAARSRLTFYGMIASRMLSHGPEFDWQLPLLDHGTFSELISYPHIARAVALVQVGLSEHAEEELKYGHGRVPSSLDRALVALTSSLNLSAAQLQIAASADTPIMAGLFPQPRWQPVGGYDIDRALVFAIIRQESKFKWNAKSGAGARGLEDR